MNGYPRVQFDIQYNMPNLIQYRSITRPGSLMSNPNGPKAGPSVDAVLPARPRPTPTALWRGLSRGSASIVSPYSRLSKHVIDCDEMQKRNKRYSLFSI